MSFSVFFSMFLNPQLLYSEAKGLFIAFESQAVFVKWAYKLRKYIGVSSEAVASYSKYCIYSLTSFSELFLITTFLKHVQCDLVSYVFIGHLATYRLSIVM